MRLFPTFCAVLILAGCAPRTLIVRNTVPVLEHGLPAMEREADPVLAEQGLPGQLTLLEGLLANDPGNRRLLTILSRGFGGYAFLFVEDKDETRAINLYLRARDLGLRALKSSKSCDLLSETDGAKVDACLAKFGKNDAAALFWTAYGWSGAAKFRLDSPDSIAELPKIERIMKRVEELSPGYFYGGPEAFLGSYYGGRPKMFGGDAAKAKAHFDKAVAVTGGKFLPVPFFYARYYAVQFQDRALFHDLLTKIAAASPEEFPEQRLANTVAINKAKELLKKEDELFE